MSLTNFTADVFSGPVPLTVQFTDLSSPTPTGWLWDFGDGNTSTLQNPQHIYALTGAFTVTLTITSPSGYAPLAQTQYITVNPPNVYTGGPNVHRIAVQGGNIVYSASDPATAVNFNINGIANIRDNLNVGNSTEIGGTITTDIGQDLLITTGTGGNLKLSPTGSILLNAVVWPTGTLNVNPGQYLGASSNNILEFYPFVIAFDGSDTLTQSQLNVLYPTAQAGQSVAGPTVMYQCISANTWRRLTSAAGTVASVDVSGGATGLVFSGGPITTSGTITANGILELDNGGTGISATVPQDILDWIVPSMSGNVGKVLGTTGTTTYWTSAGTYLAGTGLFLTGNTFSNTGVLSIATSSGISASASTGNITLSLAAIPNSALTNSSVTVNGTTISLGASGTVTAAAGTLTGATLNATVTASSLTSVGTLGSLTVSGNTTVGGLFRRSCGTGISAAGATQATATLLTKDINVVSTVSASQGVLLPAEQAGYEIIVINSSATQLNVYPNSVSAQIDNNGAAIAFQLDTGAKIMFICVSSTQWYTLNATYA